VVNVSSYKTNSYGDLLGDLIRCYNPAKVIEFGILDGYSLEHILCSCSPETEVVGYDIFTEFTGNHARKPYLLRKFGEHIIQYGDFYTKYKEISKESVDLFHIDIANDGDVYKFALDKYIPLLSKNGIMLLEGGSVERDKVDWMVKYKKTPIISVLKNLSLPHFTFTPFPSLTIIQKG
jgi:predicted O-methyltransferase YrrM